MRAAAVWDGIHFNGRIGPPPGPPLHQLTTKFAIADFGLLRSIEGTRRTLELGTRLGVWLPPGAK